MWGQGSMGVVATRAHRARLAPAPHGIEPRVGTVGVELKRDGSVTVENVTSYRHASDHAVLVEGVGELRGDIAWGGKWLFLLEAHDQALEFPRAEALTDFTWRLRQGLEPAGVTGADGALI